MEEEDMNCTSGKNKLKTILNSHKIGGVHYRGRNSIYDRFL